MKKIFGSIAKYFKGVKKEVSRIRWVSLKDLTRYSLASVVFVLFFGLFFYGVDMLISLLRSWL